MNEVTGTVCEIEQRISRFSRVPFALNNNEHPAKKNPYLDMIVEEPLNGNAERVPVGIVSKSYTLLQHKTVFDRAKEAIKAVGIDLEKLRVNLRLTEHGERMDLQFLFPESFSVTPSDGWPMSLRLRCKLGRWEPRL